MNTDTLYAEGLYVGECYGCADGEVRTALPFVNNMTPPVTRLSPRLPGHAEFFLARCARCEDTVRHVFVRYRTDDEPEGVFGAPRQAWRPPVEETAFSSFSSDAEQWAFGVRIITTT